MSTSRQFLFFCVIGATGTALHYALLIALVQGWAVHAGLAAALGATVGALTNYTLNYYFNFRSSRGHSEALPRFLAMAAIGILLNGAIVSGLSKLGVHYLLAQLLATTIILSINFLASRAWIFTNKGA